MWTSSILIILATFVGLLTLWRDELVEPKISISFDETDEQKAKRLSAEIKKEKTKRVKTISTLFIILTLIFTLYQIYQAKASTDKALQEKKEQHREDSTAYLVLDSTYAASLENGKAVTNIRKASESILDSLDNVKTKIESYSIEQIKSLKEIASQSFDILTKIPEHIIIAWSGEFSVDSFRIMDWNQELSNGKISSQSNIFFPLDEDFLFRTNLPLDAIQPFNQLFVEFNAGPQFVRFSGNFINYYLPHDKNTLSDNATEFVNIWYDSLNHLVKFEGTARLKITEISSTVTGLKSINNCRIIFRPSFTDLYTNQKGSEMTFWVLISNKFKSGGYNTLYDSKLEGYRFQESNLIKTGSN
jgi:hypothetical protein